MSQADVPERKQKWDFFSHPNGAIYREIARDVAAEVIAAAPAKASQQ